MNGYIAFYKNKRIEIYTDEGIHAAQLKAAAEFGAKKEWEVNIMLAEKDGKPVIHTAYN